MAEKLDYEPGVFTVERHVRGKWVCVQCETLVQAPVAPHIIDKGIPTTGLLAQVLVAKYLDHLPLYRQEHIFERAGLAIARSTLAQWVGECGAQLQPLVDALTAELLRHDVLHADETPVAMLKPGNGKTHRAYLWSYCTTSFNPVKAVVFDFADSRGGQHVREFLGLPGSESNPGWQGSLVCDDFSGYKACFELGVTEVGCMAHARRKFHELWVHHASPLGEQALKFFMKLYEVEREVRELGADERQAIRHEKTKPIADALHQWLTQQRQKVPDGSATAKAIDYSLNRWEALTRFIDDGDLPIDNNWVENQIRPIAIGRNNWLFAGSLRAGQARRRDHEPGALGAAQRARSLRVPQDVLERLPTQPASRIDELLPHRWTQPAEYQPPSHIALAASTMTSLAAYHPLTVREVQTARDGDHSGGGGLRAECAMTRRVGCSGSHHQPGRRREMGLGAERRSIAAQIGDSADHSASWRTMLEICCSEASTRSYQSLPRFPHARGVHTENRAPMLTRVNPQDRVRCQAENAPTSFGP